MPTDAQEADDRNDRVARLLLAQEVHSFLHTEADLLDQRRYREWLDLLAEDVRFWAPIPSNLPRDVIDTEEWTRERSELAWFDEGKETLTQRVRQIETGIHWAEEPPSRTCRMISNIEVVGARPSFAAATTVEVCCRFLLYRNRLHDEEDLLIGKRRDTLVKVDGSWRLGRREIRLDQSVLLAKNLAALL